MRSKLLIQESVCSLQSGLKVLLDGRSDRDLHVVRRLISVDLSVVYYLNILGRSTLIFIEVNAAATWLGLDAVFVDG